MAEIFEKMEVEFVDQDESVQVVADSIRDTGEVPERYVRSEICRDCSTPIFLRRSLLRLDLPASSGDSSRFVLLQKLAPFDACLPTFISLSVCMYNSIAL